MSGLVYFQGGYMCKCETLSLMRNGCKCASTDDNKTLISDKISVTTKEKNKGSRKNIMVLKPFLNFVESIQKSDLHLITDREFVPAALELTTSLFNDGLDDDSYPYVNLKGPLYSESLHNWPNCVKNFQFDPNYIYYGFGRTFWWVEDTDPTNKFYILKNNNGTYSKSFYDSDQFLFEDLAKRINKRKAVVYDKSYESTYYHGDGSKSEFTVQAYLWNGGTGRCCISDERYNKCGIESNIAIGKICKRGHALTWDNNIRFICPPCYKEKKEFSFRDLSSIR